MKGIKIKMMETDDGDQEVLLDNMDEQRLEASNANFTSSLPNPLRDYATKCFSSIKNDDDALPSSSGGLVDDQQRLDEFEISVRSHLLNLIERLLAFQSSCDSGGGGDANAVDEDEEVALKTLLRYLKDVTLLCLHIAIMEEQQQPASTSAAAAASSASIKKLPFLLIEDTVDSLPLLYIQQIYLSVVSYINILTTPHLFIPLSKFILLRICNKILKLLSKYRDVHANFAGSIMILLAQVFPLSERSAINVLGAFNVSNETRVESVVEFERGSQLRKSSGGCDNGVGYDFYAKFWGVQKVFSDPMGTILASTKVVGGGSGKGEGGGMMSQAQAVKAYECFIKDITDILEALESTPIVVASSASSFPVGENDDNNDTAQQQQTTSSVRHHKYLTSSQLLHLQLKDPTLRLHFLTQLLIILSYFSSPSTPLPTGVQSTAGADTSKLTSQIRQTQMKQLGLIEKRTLELLRRSSSSVGNQCSSSSASSGNNNNDDPSGENMWRSLQWILRDRESMWKNWKKAKCLPAMDRVAASGGGGNAAAGGGGNNVVCGNDVKKMLLLAVGSKKRKMEDVLSSKIDEDNIFDIEKLARVTSEIKSSSQPKLASFLEPYTEALDPENGIEGEYHPRNDKVYTWRALRLMARDYEDDGEGLLKRFGKLRRRDGDFEGIVRDAWKEKGEEIPGGDVMEDYYHGEEVEEEKEEEVVPAGPTDVDMDDFSVGSTQEEVDAKKERMAEFEKAAMEVEDDMLNDNDMASENAVADDDGGGGVNGSDVAPSAATAEAVAKHEAAKEEGKEDGETVEGKDNKTVEIKDNKTVEIKEEKKVQVKQEKKTESKDENNEEDVKNISSKEEKKGGIEMDNSNSKSTNIKSEEGKGNDLNGKVKKEKDNGKTGEGKGGKEEDMSSAKSSGENKTSDNMKNDLKPRPRSRSKFTPPQKVQHNKAEPRDNSNPRGGGGGGGGADRRGGNDRRGNSMPPPPQSRGGIRDGPSHSPPNQGGQRGNTGAPRGGGPGRGWEPPSGRGGGGRGGPERDNRGSHRRR